MRGVFLAGELVGERRFFRGEGVVGELGAEDVAKSLCDLIGGDLCGDGALVEHAGFASALGGTGKFVAGVGDDVAGNGVLEAFVLATGGGFEI